MSDTPTSSEDSDLAKFAAVAVTGNQIAEGAVKSAQVNPAIINSLIQSLISPLSGCTVTILLFCCHITDQLHILPSYATGLS